MTSSSITITTPSLAGLPIELVLKIAIYESWFKSYVNALRIEAGFLWDSLAQPETSTLSPSA
ncbi:hypothetical protein HYE67_010076 [Fusarium culmorum]|uniref:Uncharacterized protein n=1 Tax=Fusarium culmorum TaxID=5516 RepID=A0A2T4H9K0_FUSCU|nr:hypothetical protein FCULG_00005029 [Fusarium culmorum]QPC67845.1 hypothetical protein HYE67_010076 [Fusarium culmorum]